MKLSRDQEHGKVYGTFTWRGKEIPQIKRIGNTGKSQWKLISIPDYKGFVPDKAPLRSRKIIDVGN